MMQKQIRLLKVLKSHNISADYLIKSADRKTTVKTRIVAHNQQIARVDQESKSELCSEEEKKVLEFRKASNRSSSRHIIF